MRNESFFLVFIIFVCSFDARAQFTNFDKGFKVGFENGYCYSSSPNAGYFCNPPIPPLPPLPDVFTERSDSWRDGYNRGFIVGRAKRDEVDYKKQNQATDNGIPSFRPYVPQNPLILLSPEQIERLQIAKAERERAQAEAIGQLFEAIFTPKQLTAEEQRKKDMDELKRKQEIAARKYQRFLRKDAKRLTVGTEKYLFFKKSKTQWLNATIASTILTTLTYFQANKYADKYNTATTDATSIRKTGNTLYQILPIFVVSTGVSFCEFVYRYKKIHKAKPALLGL